VCMCVCVCVCVRVCTRARASACACACALVPKSYFTHKNTYAYLPIFMSSLKEHWNSDLFLAGDG